MHFDDFVNMVKLTINELEHRLLESFKTYIQEEKKRGKRRIPKNCGIVSEGATYI